MSRKVVAIVWKLEYKLHERHFKVHWTWCESDETKNARLGVPQTWQFAMPEEFGFARERFGASETRGLVGGVESPRLARLSEQFERAVSDVMTYALCGRLNQSLQKQDDEGSVFVFGPALPKMIGRFWSLRLPEQVRIAWICPVPFPGWLAERGDELLLVPGRHLTLSEDDLKSTAYHLWEDESLVAGFRWQHESTDYIVQYLLHRSFQNSVVDELGLKELKGVVAGFAGDLWLPREIIAAAGQVDLQTRDPYDPIKEVPIRPHGAKFALPVYTFPAGCRADSESRCWHINWGS
jgi:hypothetical protein